jgi:hypothetical protein
MRNNNAEETARAIVRCIEKNARGVFKPGLFRFMFLLNTLFPVTTDVLMRIGWRGSPN